MSRYTSSGASRACGAGGLVYTAILARALIGERINRLEAAGMVIAVAAVTLANLG